MTRQIGTISSCAAQRPVPQNSDSGQGLASLTIAASFPVLTKVPATGSPMFESGLRYPRRRFVVEHQRTGTMNAGPQARGAFAAMLAIGTLAIASGTQAQSRVPENVLRASWNPDRDQATVLEELPASGSPELDQVSSRSALSQRS